MEQVINHLRTYKSYYLYTLIFLSLLFVMPLVALIFAVVNFRHRLAPVFFCVFAFYFGWNYSFLKDSDLVTHYEHFLKTLDIDLITVWRDPDTAFYGGELFPVLFKYIIGKIDSSLEFFSGSACMSYALCFIIMLLSIKDLWRKPMNILTALSFLGIVFTVEFYWFQGLRYWLGAFIFFTFYIKYIRSQERKYLLLTGLSLCFHFSYVALIILAIAVEVLGKRFKLVYPLLLVAFLVHFYEIDLLYLIVTNPITSLFVKQTHIDLFTSKNYLDVMQELREYRMTANIFYIHRSDIIFAGVCPIMLFLYRQNRQMFAYKTKFIRFLFLLFIVTHMGYSSLTFYERTYEVFLLGLFIYLFLYLQDYKPWMNKNYYILSVIILTIPILYALFTAVVTTRATLVNPAEWWNKMLFTLTL